MTPRKQPRVLAVLYLLALAGCSSSASSPLPPPPKTYRQAVVEAGITYSTLARAATAYAQQKRCGPEAPPPPLCADAETVVVLGRYSRAASSALTVAQQLDGVAVSADAQARALAAVEAALTDLSATTSTAKGK
jgi:hypothetical protein